MTPMFSNRVRNKFLLTQTLRQVTDALGWVNDAPPSDVLDLAAASMVDAQRSLIALGAEAPKRIAEEIA